MTKRAIIAVDFDGTCVEHFYPTIGPDVPGACRHRHSEIGEVSNADL